VNVAFVTNHQKTEFLMGIAGRLESSGHNVFWISSGNRWTRYLASGGVMPEKILNLAELGDAWAHGTVTVAQCATNLTCAGSVDEPTANDIILMDRLLVAKPAEYGRRYVAVVRNQVDNFLVANRVEAVFGEATWALEVVTSLVCRARSISFYSPQVVRIPDERFAFFEGRLQTRLPNIRKVTEADHSLAQAFYRNYVEKRPRPAYWHLNNRVPSLQFSWLPKLAGYLTAGSTDRYDETIFPTPWLVKRRLAEVVQAHQLKWFVRWQSGQQPGGRPYVLYALHKQPESSVDVMASYLSNQTELVRAVARSLPATHDLYVKEHRNCIGDNGLSFYRELSRIPSVKLISPYADSHELIAGAEAVMTITGTIAYEAGLLGTSAITFVPMYFGSLLAVNGCNPYNESFRSDLARVLQEPARLPQKEAEARAVDYLAGVFANSFAGNISDPRTDIRCMSDENLDRVAAGFEQMFGVLRASAPLPGDLQGVAL
jgi:hypothetical protein